MSDTKKYLELPQEDGAASPKPKYGLGMRHLQMLCMTICMIALFMARSSMGVAILAMTDVNRINDTNVQIYDWDKKTQGIVLSSFFWGYMIMQIPAGTLAKRFGGKPVLEVALLTTAIVCLATPLLVQFGGWYILCAGRVIIGLSQACTFTSSHTLLGKWLPASERTQYIGLVYGGAAMGVIIAMPVSGALSETVLGWKMIFYAISAVSFVAATMWHFLAASYPCENKWISKEEIEYIEEEINSSENTKVPRTPWKQILTSRGMLAVLIAHIGSSFIYTLILVDLPTFLERGLQISLKNSASLSALPYFGMWVGGIVSGWLSQILLNKKLLSLPAARISFNSLAYCGAAFGLIILSFLGPDTRHWAVVSLVSVLFFQGFSSAGFMANYLDISPNFGGVMLSITNFISNMGAILTPIITSFILKNDPTDLSRWRIVFLVFGIQSIGASILYAVLGTFKVAPWDDPEYFNQSPITTKPKVEELKKEMVKH